MVTEDKFEEIKTKAKEIFDKNPLVHCPYFGQEITLNSDGFHHLQFSDRRERNKDEQVLKFNLLPLAIKVVRKSGTVQEYRKSFCAIGKKSKRDGLTLLKNMEFWAFVAIIGDTPIRIRVILRRIGDGKIILWSVMSASKLKRDDTEKMKVLAKKGIEDD